MTILRLGQLSTGLGRHVPKGLDRAEASGPVGFGPESKGPNPTGPNNTIPLIGCVCFEGGGDWKITILLTK